MSSVDGLVSLAPFENQCVPRDCTRAALIGRRPAPLAQFDPSAPQGRTWRLTNCCFHKLLRVEIEKIDPYAPTVDVATKIDLEECWGKTIGK